MNSKLRSGTPWDGLVLWLLRNYKRHFSFLFGRACRFTPTCSEYTYQAVERYGTITGLFLGLKRVLRCNPWNKGGFDPVT